MSTKRFVVLLALAFAIPSCNLFKKSKGDDVDSLPVVHLDTITATPSDPEPQVYQASATRVNDIIHTKLDVSFDWQKQYLYGKATIDVKPYFYPVSTLELDARGMEIKQVNMVLYDKQAPGAAIIKPMGAKILEYTYENDVLKINLGREYKNNEQYTVFIEYVARPNELKSYGGSAAITDDKGLYFINPDGKEKNKPQQIWTQGETQASSVWYPTIDRPNERMTQEIFMTVHKKFVTLSNGELVSSFDNGDSTRTDHWKMDLPFAPYLSMMAVGDFAVVKDKKWRGREVNYYVEKEYEAHAMAIFGNTPEMLDFYSSVLGVEYPWNKYSQIVVRDYVSGAMENVTATLHGEFMQQTDRELLDSDHESVIAHELFHQWFGDLVTCESWSNTPLNESFATYGEYLWIEHKYGRDAADEHSARSRAGYFAEASRKSVDLIRFQYDDKEDMFDAHSYNKGGQILHMLRKYIGDDAFFASLKLYLETNKFTAVEVHNLRLAFEQVSGEDLNWFFNQWFLDSGHPDLVINKRYDAEKKKQMVQIRQVQDFTTTPLFRIPMYIDVYTGSQVKRHKVVLTKAEENFEFDAESKPDLVNVDGDKMLLCTKHENKTNEELAFQFAHANLYLDRLEALQGLAPHASDSLATYTIIAALDDKFEGIRYEAITMLKDVAPGNEKKIKDKLVALAKVDGKSMVRAYAMDFLSKNYKDADLDVLYRNGLNDRSYTVIGTALAGIAKSNFEEALKLAKNYENEKSVDILYAVADLYANYGSDEHNTFFVNSAERFTGYGKIGFVTLYTSFLKRVQKNETVLNGAGLLAEIANDKSSSKWVTYYAKKSVRELATMYETNASYAREKIKVQKAANPQANTRQLEDQAADADAQAEKIKEILRNLR